MRNFKIGSKVESKKNSYEIVITFMVGDADGEEKVNLVFDENKIVKSIQNTASWLL